MKKFLIAVAASLILFGGQVQAAPADDLNVDIETQDVKSHGKWAHFRDKYLLGRETENERRDRKEWERKHRYAPHRYRDDDRYRPPTPPPYYRDGRRYYPPNPPPPPPYYRDGRRYYPPNPPPTPPPPTRRR